MEKKSYSCCVLLIFVLIFSSCAYRPKQPSNLELLSSIENAFVDIAAQSKPAIVGILAGNSKWNNPRWGSGFFFRQDGHILTNDHIVHGAEYYKVGLLDGSTLDAKLVGTDIITDIGVLKVDGNQDFPTLPLADSEKVQVGQFAIAIGNPFQLDYTVTTGVVSGKGRSILGKLRPIRYENFIQTDAWINTGSSGGPLLNIHGEVIGINALIRKAENTPAPMRAGAGFAIPSNLVNTIGDQLIANGKIIRGFLGIGMREASKGIRVSAVRLNTPADRAGLEQHDIIIEYNGEKVEKIHDFRMLVAESQVGKQSVIKVLRRGQERTLNVTIGEMPPELSGIPFESESVSWRMLGLAVRKLEKGDSQRYTYLTDNDQGVIVERVKVNAPGFNAKIPRGALILAINGKEINDVQTLEALLQTQIDALELIIDIKSSHGKEKLTVHLQK
ncbi:MAG: trypsin-like peptidase domain-containing protein [Candidatus Poribacteria bacterium]|nr:trypsin-like peptidase domain-containing protein [Candidatus Poribacteria bacterium]